MASSVPLRISHFNVPHPHVFSLSFRVHMHLYTVSMCCNWGISDSAQANRKIDPPFYSPPPGQHTPVPSGGA